jgi:hypothetical protein
MFTVVVFTNFSGRTPGFEQLEVKQTDDSSPHMAAVTELFASFTKRS